VALDASPDVEEDQTQRAADPRDEQERTLDLLAGSVGVHLAAVDPEQHDHRNRHQARQLPAGRHQETEHQHREQEQGTTEAELDLQDPRHGAEQRSAQEDQRQTPGVGVAELPRPERQRERREQRLEVEQRVEHARVELPDRQAAVGQRRRGIQPDPRAGEEQRRDPPTAVTGPRS
jgi:hypothetical protein